SEGEIQEGRNAGNQEKKSPVGLLKNSFPGFLGSWLPVSSPGKLSAILRAPSGVPNAYSLGRRDSLLVPKISDHDTRTRPPGCCGATGRGGRRSPSWPRLRRGERPPEVRRAGRPARRCAPGARGRLWERRESGSSCRGRKRTANRWWPARL